MDIRYFHERVRDIQDVLRTSGFPKATVTVYAEASHESVGLHIRPHGYGTGTCEPFRAADPETTIRDAMAYAETVIMQASRNDREVAAMLGILPDGRLIPDYAEAAE